jgi:hypothetical protein
LAGFVVAASQDFALVWWKSKKSQEQLITFILLQCSQFIRMLQLPNFFGFIGYILLYSNTRLLSFGLCDQI